MVIPAVAWPIVFDDALDGVSGPGEVSSAGDFRMTQSPQALAYPLTDTD